MAHVRWLVIETALAAAVFAVLVSRVPTVGHFLANNDHGYQLAAAAELLRGRLPGVDVFINYGPLVVLSSAAALYPNPDSLVVEVLVCAAAWAAAVWIAFRLARRNFGVLAGCCSAASAYVCIPRFHKWWVWLVPLAALAAVDAARGVPGPRRFALGGFVCGLGMLIRPDLGVASLVGLMTIAFADSWRPRGASWPTAWLPLVVGCAVPLVLWALVLVAFAGVGGLGRALSVVPEMVFGTVSSLNLPPPRFRWDAPFTADSAHVLALRLLPVTAIFAVVLGWWLYRDDARGMARQGRALLAIGVFGLVTYHSALYRADIHHLWQGIWPLTLAVPGIAAVAARLMRMPTSGAERAVHLVVILGAATLVLLSTIGLLPILRQPHFDLTPYGRPWLAGLSELRLGLAAAPEHPYAQLVDSITRWSRPNDEVLDLVYGPQLLFFAQRPTHGPTVAFQRGLFDSAAWRRERLAEIERHPPALVIVPMAFWQLGPDDPLRVSLPEIYDFVRAHYPRVVDRRGLYMLLAADPSFRPPSG